MSNLPIRKTENGNLPTRTTRDPFEMMRDFMSSWDPFAVLAPSWPTERNYLIRPAFDVKETPDGFEFHADLPGIEEKDLEVTTAANRLTVTGKRESDSEQKTDTYHSRERSYGSFSRTFTLPEGADLDHVRADLKKGVLSVIIPKKAEAQPKKIAIGAEKNKA
jgi:HSP20 family protein